RALKFPIDQWDFVLFNSFLSKLDDKTRTEFEIKYGSVDVPSYQQLKKFLDNHCRALESVTILSSSLSKPKSFASSVSSSIACKKSTSSFVADTPTTAG